MYINIVDFVVMTGMATLHERIMFVLTSIFKIPL
jgi:hypothetical protein